MRSADWHLQSTGVWPVPRHSDILSDEPDSKYNGLPSIKPITNDPRRLTLDLNPFPPLPANPQNVA